MQGKKTRLMTESALIAAVYVALVLLFKPISFGAIQFRIAEALFQSVRSSGTGHRLPVRKFLFRSGNAGCDFRNICDASRGYFKL